MSDMSHDASVCRNYLDLVCIEIEITRLCDSYDEVGQVLACLEIQRHDCIMGGGRRSEISNANSAKHFFFSVSTEPKNAAQVS